MSALIKSLGRKAQRGSKPRCHLLTHGPGETVAARLTALAAPFALVSPSDHWMPQGFVLREEAQLHKAPGLLDPVICAQLAAWWLPPDNQDARTPNFDIASTCTIEGTRGLMLIEAKAHDEELNKVIAGRTLKADTSKDRKASHKTIARAITSARKGLEHITSLPWRISRCTHYQMSNRFAWSWKLTELGIPVVLIYLGFLNAKEMGDRGKPFADHGEWDRLVRSHSAALLPDEVWNRKWKVHGPAFIPLIRSTEISLDAIAGAAEKNNGA